MFKEKVFLKFLIVLLFLVVLVSNFFYKWDHQHYAYLADAFKNGRMDLPLASAFDSARYGGKFFWPLGIFPAILIFPASLIFGFWNYWQPVFTVILAFFTFGLVFKISDYFKFSKNDSLWLSVFFVFATPLLGAILVPTSWHFAHLCAVLFVLLSVFEFFTKKRLWLVGILVSAAFLSRPLTIFTLLFFIWLTIFQNQNKKITIKNLIYLLIPVFFSIGIFGLYNYLRFQNPFEAGYRYQFVDADGVFVSAGGQYLSFSYPLKNFFKIFLAGLIPVKLWANEFILNPLNYSGSGVSIFLTSPLLILAFLAPFKNKFVVPLLVSIVVISLLLIFSFGTGGLQIGSRYSLDFLPLMFILVLIQMKGKVKLWQKALILIQIIYILLLFVPLAKQRGLL